MNAIEALRGLLRFSDFAGEAETQRLVDEQIVEARAAKERAGRRRGSALRRRAGESEGSR